MNKLLNFTKNLKNNNNHYFAYFTNPNFRCDNNLQEKPENVDKMNKHQLLYICMKHYPSFQRFMVSVIQVLMVKSSYECWKSGDYITYLKLLPFHAALASGTKKYKTARNISAELDDWASILTDNPQMFYNMVCNHDLVNDLFI